MSNIDSSLPVWVYVVFRKSPSSSHEKLTVNITTDGPVFWNRHVVYVFCCSCHFENHEDGLLNILRRFSPRIERVCLVDRPVDYSFLPDSLFSFMANALPQLQFVYLRELDLEKINRGTVEKLSLHRQLKKVIVHGCRNYEVLQDFHNLPQLLVVKGEIVGLRNMIGDIDNEPGVSSSSLSTSTIESENSEIGEKDRGISPFHGSRLTAANSERRLRSTPSPVTVNGQ